jgi:hypothetical protein
MLPGRSDSSVRNRWMRMLKDRELMKTQTEALRREQRAAAQIRPPPLLPCGGAVLRPFASMPPTAMLAARIADAQMQAGKSALPDAAAVSVLAVRIAEADAISASMPIMDWRTSSEIGGLSPPPDSDEEDAEYPA